MNVNLGVSNTEMGMNTQEQLTLSLKATAMAMDHQHSSKTDLWDNKLSLQWEV